MLTEPDLELHRKRAPLRAGDNNDISLTFSADGTSQQPDRLRTEEREPNPLKGNRVELNQDWCRGGSDGTNKSELQRWSARREKNQTRRRHQHVKTRLKNGKIGKLTKRLVSVEGEVGEAGDKAAATTSSPGCWRRGSWCCLRVAMALWLQRRGCGWRGLSISSASLAQRRSWRRQGRRTPVAPLTKLNVFPGIVLGDEETQVEERTAAA